MKILKQFYLFLFVIVLSSSSFLFSMNEDGSIDELNDRMSDISINEPRFVSESNDSSSEDDSDTDFDLLYDSDSEDEEGYEYQGFSDFEIPEHLRGRGCLVLFRGIHFSRSFFTKEQRSHLRRTSLTGRPIYSSAVYDVSNIEFDAEDFDEELVLENAIVIRDRIIRLSSANRNRFQDLYVNKYENFHSKLENTSEEDEEIFHGFDSSMNPQLSFSEILLHPYKYAFGQKSWMRSNGILEPEYDEFGEPKHSYLGEIYIVMIPIDEIEEIDPYFVVSSHARNKINISNHFSNNILSEREITIPGFIYGRYVVYSKAVRVPSFSWEEYQSYYEAKYGITQRSFKIQQTKLENHDFKYKNIIKKVFKHNSIKLMEHIQSVCAEAENDVTIVYRDFALGFTTELPSLDLAKENRNMRREDRNIIVH